MRKQSRQSKNRKPSKEKRVRVVRRKLGRERADGICFFDGKVHVDERLRGIELLWTLIHELLHHEFPQLSEDAVDKAAKSMATTMYDDKWRRIEE